MASFERLDPALQRALDALPGVIWEYRPAERRFTFVSRPVEALLGYPREAWLQPGFWEEHIVAADRAETVAACCRDGRGRRELQYRMTAADGREVWIHDFASPAEDEPGAVRGMMVDATTVRLQQQHVVTSEQYLRSVLNSFEGFVLSINRERKVTGVFGRGLRHSRRPASELVGSTLTDFLGPEASAQDEEAVSRALAGESTCFERASILHPEGEQPRHYVIRMVPTRDVEGRVVGALAIVLDETERKRLHQQLLHADRLASLGALATGVAHELANPISWVVTNLDFLAAELPQLKSHAKEEAHPLVDELQSSVKDAREGVDRLKDISQQLRAYARGGSAEEATQPVSPKEIAEQAAKMARTGAPASVRFELLLEDTPSVMANPIRLTQVLVNLMVNALQALPGRGTISVRTTRAEHEVRFEVKDTGPGIPANILPRIFEPFFTTKPVGVGTGLGLSVSNSIVRGYGGRIDVQSEEGKGTTFTVALPIPRS